MDTLHTFWDNNTHCKTESVKFLGLMNSATEEYKVSGLGCTIPARGSGPQVFDL